ncbi:uncharacterized protein ColSpa_12345 [Colletotrichum spaethianum]|uniref:Uncharacterized protein n=1 Tax=Colletotrichum spaethianum TaxID=700344 RepID=A0AA37PHB9_9PEZI|nr:uncharacterized protein ColSpa_12345 [Colletotrichum spaethianum]GKT52164.1 hypothetical protein ColSpa_12345 [Colletotrichum spaethianum]
MNSGFPRRAAPALGLRVFPHGAAPAADDTACDQLRWTFDNIAQIVLTLVWKHDGHMLYDTCENVFVSDLSLQGAYTKDLRARFRTMRDKNEIPEGVHRDCFLVTDTQTPTCDYIAQKKEYRGGDEWVPYVNAFDSDFDETTEPPEGGFAGQISVPLPKVFD